MGDKQLHWRNTSYILHNGRMISLEEFAIYLWRTGRQGLQDSQHKEIQILKMLMLAILDRPFYIMYMHYITLWRPWIQKKNMQFTWWNAAVFSLTPSLSVILHSPPTGSHGLQLFVPKLHFNPDSKDDRSFLVNILLNSPHICWILSFTQMCSLVHMLKLAPPSADGHWGVSILGVLRTKLLWMLFVTNSTNASQALHL